jgi:hypothetical protein
MGVVHRTEDTLKAIMQRKEREKYQRISRNRRRWARINDFLETKHDCQLWHGSAKIGAPVQMTGQEMVNRNRANEDKFKAQLDAGKSSAKLMKWAAIKKDWSCTLAEHQEFKATIKAMRPREEPLPFGDEKRARYR